MDSCQLCPAARTIAELEAKVRELQRFQHETAYLRAEAKTEK